MHYKEAKEDKLAALRVANTKKHDFRSFMETFLAAATRIADGIDLDEFVAPSSPPQEGQKTSELHTLNLPRYAE